MVNRTEPLHRQTDREYLLDMERKHKKEVKDNEFQRLLDIEVAKLKCNKKN